MRSIIMAVTIHGAQHDSGGEHEQDHHGGRGAIIAPSGEIVAQCATKDDELIVAHCDLYLSARNKDAPLNFAARRRIEHYGIITEQTGVIPPE